MPDPFAPLDNSNEVAPKDPWADADPAGVEGNSTLAEQDKENGFKVTTVAKATISFDALARLFKRIFS